MSKCRATSFYLEPGKLMYFKDHVLAARVPTSPDAAADEWFLVPITHRRDVARIQELYPHWDGGMFSASITELKGLAFSELSSRDLVEQPHLALREAVTEYPRAVGRHITSERLIEGRRPYKDGEDFARVSYLVYRWSGAISRGAALDSVGGAANLVEDLFPNHLLRGEGTKAQKKVLRKLVENGEVAKVSAVALLLANGILDLSTAEGQQKFHALLEAPSIPVPVDLPLLVAERLSAVIRASREAGFEVDLVGILADAISPDRLLGAEAACLVVSSRAAPAELREAVRQSVKTEGNAPKGYRPFIKELRAALAESSSEDAANVEPPGAETPQQAWERTRDPAVLLAAVRRGRREDLEWILSFGDDAADSTPEGIDEILEATRVLLGVPRPHPLMRPLHEHLLTVDLINESRYREHVAATLREVGIIEELAQLQNVALHLGREVSRKRFAALSPSQESLARHLERGVEARKPVDSKGSPVELSIILTEEELYENADSMVNCTYDMHNEGLFRNRERKKILLALTGNFGEGKKKYNVMLHRGADGVWVFGEINGFKNLVAGRKLFGTPTPEQLAILNQVKRSLAPLLTGQNGKTTPERAPDVRIVTLPPVPRPEPRPAVAPELSLLPDDFRELCAHADQYVARLAADPRGDVHYVVFRTLHLAPLTNLYRMRSVCARIYAVLDRQYRVDLTRQSTAHELFWDGVQREATRN